MGLPHGTSVCEVQRLTHASVFLLPWIHGSMIQLDRKQMSLSGRTCAGHILSTEVGLFRDTEVHFSIIYS